MNKGQIPEDQLIEWLRTALPDSTYFLGLIKRYRFFIIATITLTMVSSLIGYNQVKNKYQSDTSVVIKADNRTVISRILEPIDTAEHINSFNTLTRSQKFLGEVYDLVLREGIIKDDRLEKESFVSKIKKGIKNAIATLKGEVYDLENEKFKGRLRAIDRLNEAFIAYSSDTGVLTVEGFFDAPDSAQKITQIAMNHFIVTELESEVAYLEQKSQSLKANMDLVKSNYSQVKEGMKASMSREQEETSTRRESELELSEKVRELTSEINSLNLDKTRNRMGLETEYKRLSAILQPDHPTLVAKRREIMALNADDSLTGKEKQRDDLKNRLKEVRRKFGGRDPLVDPGFGDSVFNLNLLTSGLNEIEIEKEKVIKDLMNPAQSTIFRTIKPPALNLKPYINLKAKVGFGVVFVGVFILFTGIFMMEFFSEKAQDGWRIRRISGKEIIAKLPRVKIDDVKGEEELLKQWVRGKVAPAILKKGYIHGILENRAFEISLIENCVGKTIFLTELTDLSQCSHYIKNFINLFSKDQAHSAAVFDFNFVSPLIPEGTLKKVSRETQVMVGLPKGGFESNFYPVISPVSGKSLGTFFDYFPIYEEENGFKFLKGTTESNFFDVFHKTYEWIFVLGFPASFSVENRKLQKYVSDTVVFLDCESTRYTVLKRLVIDLEQANIRGVAMLEAAA